MLFKKTDDPDGWPFAHAERVEVLNINGCLVVDGKYAMNGLASMIMKLPDVPIVDGKSVGEYIKKMKKEK